MNSGNRKMIISVSLPEDLNDIVSDVCQHYGIPKSRIMVQALELLLRVRYPDMFHLLDVKRGFEVSRNG